MTPPSLSLYGLIVPLLFLKKDKFGIKSPKMIAMTFNKETYIYIYIYIYIYTLI